MSPDDFEQAVDVLTRWGVDKSFACIFVRWVSVSTREAMMENWETVDPKTAGRLEALAQEYHKGREDMRQALAALIQKIEI